MTKVGHLGREEAESKLRAFLPGGLEAEVYGRGRYSSGWAFFVAWSKPDDGGVYPPGGSGVVAVSDDGATRYVTPPNPDGIAILAELDEMEGPDVASDGMHVIM